jgi:hypothetical protein
MLQEIGKDGKKYLLCNKGLSKRKNSDHEEG